MGKFIVVYEVATKKTNDQFRRWTAWNTLVEKDTLSEAYKCFHGLADLHPEYCRVAIFKVCGGDTFKRQPRYLDDRRDKSGWVFYGLTGLINSRSSADL